MTRWLRGVAASLLSAHALVAANQVAPPAPPQQPTFRSATLVVEVDAIVTDREGRFVPDLAAEEFEILEDGRPQIIQSLYVIEEGSRARVALASAQGPARVPVTRRVFVWFVDDEHVSPGSFDRLRSGLGEFLRAEFRAQDIGGLVVGGRMAGGRLTSDREELLTHLRQARASAETRLRRLDLQNWPRFASETEALRIVAGDREVTRVVLDRAFADEPEMCAKVDCGLSVQEKARLLASAVRAAANRTLSTVSALTSGLAKIEGRKTVVFVTEGFPADEASDALRRLAGTAASGGVTFYSLDPRGLGRTPPAGDLADPDSRPMEHRLPAGVLDTSDDGPSSLAADTGGLFIRNTNRLDLALSEIARDASGYYVFGYSPTNTTFNGAWRRIEVRVKRKGLSVRARRGYLASGAAPVLTRLDPASPSVPADLNRAPVPAPGAEPPARVEEVAVPPAIGAAVVKPAGERPPPAAAPVPEAAEPAAPALSAVRLRPDTVERVARLQAEGEGARAEPGEAAGSPGTVDPHAREGWDRYQRGDLEGAREALAAAATPSARPWVRYALGLAEYGLGHPREAAASWERVRTAVPAFQPVYFDLADSYLSLDDLGSALRVLRAAEVRWPQDLEVLNALGVVQVRRGALDDAIRMFDRAVVADPKDATAYFNLGRAYEIRYDRSQRWSRVAKSWSANRADLEAARANYRQYLAIGGPLEVSVREALKRLDRMK